MASKTQQSDAEKLREQFRDQYPNAWIPVEAGDTLQGTLREVSRAWSDARAKNGEGWYPLLRVETDDGTLLDFHAFSTVSYNRVMELQPVPGERIVVSFQGLGKAKQGQNAPKLYHLRVEGRDPVAAANAVYARMGDGTLVHDAREAARQAQTGETLDDAVRSGKVVTDPDELPF